MVFAAVNFKIMTFQEVAECNDFEDDRSPTIRCKSAIKYPFA